MDDLLIGTIQSMTVHKILDSRFLLKKGVVEAFLQKEDVEESLALDQTLEVFLYKDKSNRVIATTQLPEIVIGEYGWAKVVDVIPHLGAFVDIGTTTDILVSIDDLPLFKSVWPQKDDELYVTLDKDRDGRLLAIPASENILAGEWDLAHNVELNDMVTGRAYRADREGTAIITAQNYRGFIHHSEREREIRLGERVEGRVIEVKEDGTLNVSLMPLKHERIDDDAETILAYLEKNSGFMPFSDKSAPEDIRQTFNMSKSAFKRALGRLMKDKKVEQRNGQTFLI